MALERQAVAEIESAVATHGHDIAALIIEPIQGEGGDNHFRAEFLEKLRAARRRARVPAHLRRGADRLRHYRKVVVVRAFRRRAGHLRLRQEDADLRPRRRSAGRRGRLGVQDLVAHQLDLGRQPRRHGALPADHRGHRGGWPARQRHRGRGPPARRASASSSASSPARSPTAAAAASSSPSTCRTPTTRNRTLTALNDSDVLGLASGDRAIRMRPPLVLSRAEADLGLRRIERALATVLG